MNTVEFGEYLKSIGGLINGYYIDREPITHNMCECDEGWLELIKNCIDECISAGWDKQICQIKEKFGGLRFYINSGNDEVFNIIEKYQKLSYETCEMCGSTENVELRNGSWIRTLCDDCCK